MALIEKYDRLVDTLMTGFTSTWLLFWQRRTDDDTFARPYWC